MAVGHTCFVEWEDFPENITVKDMSSNRKRKYVLDTSSLPKVYLCGGIDILDGQPVDSWGYWRDDAKRDLKGIMNVLDPREQGVFTYCRDIVTNDLKMIDEADYVMVEYMDPRRQYEGTMMELFYAYSKGKKVIMFSKSLWNEPMLKHPWIHAHITYICPTYAGAIDWLKAQL